MPRTRITNLIYNRNWCIACSDSFYRRHARPCRRHAMRGKAVRVLVRPRAWPLMGKAKADGWFKTQMLEHQPVWASVERLPLVLRNLLELSASLLGSLDGEDASNRLAHHLNPVDSARLPADLATQQTISRQQYLRPSCLLTSSLAQGVSHKTPARNCWQGRVICMRSAKNLSSQRATAGEHTRGLSVPTDSAIGSEPWPRILEGVVAAVMGERQNKHRGGGGLLLACPHLLSHPQRHELRPQLLLHPIKVSHCLQKSWGQHDFLVGVRAFASRLCIHSESECKSPHLSRRHATQSTCTIQETQE